MTCKRLQEQKNTRQGCVTLYVCVCDCVGLPLSLIIPRLRQIEGDLPFDLNLHTIYP